MYVIHTHDSLCIHTMFKIHKINIINKFLTFYDHLWSPFDISYVMLHFQVNWLFSTSKKVVWFIRYENCIIPLNYKLQELIIAERMRSIGEGNVENQVPYRCHIICHMNRFMVNSWGCWLLDPKILTVQIIYEYVMWFTTFLG